MNAVILAGGQSKRMGLDKAFIRIGELTIIERLLSILSKLFDKTIIIANRKGKYEDFGFPVFSDIHPNKGPLGGIYTGLKVSGSFYNLFVASDMPFIDEKFLSYMKSLSQDYDVLVPWDEKGYQPLCSVYSKNCLKPLEEHLIRDDLKIINIYHSLKVKNITKKEIIKNSQHKYLFFDINTKKDLEIALQIYEKSG